ncbi:MAG TPA: DegT/DnrJ/EryC1/StrS family aminotransferase [Casimicrobiaceae bacterium]
MHDIPVFKFESDPDLEQSLRAASDRVLTSGRYVLGTEAAGFEREFAEFCGVAECIGVANGTDALELALRALGVGAGDRVATVANAGFYSCAALSAIGAQPVFIDVDDTLTMSPERLREAGGELKAIIVTHLYGRLGHIDEIAAYAADRGLPVIEDCAQAHGASRGDKCAGSFGAVGCFSFYPTKNLGALGDGGAIVTSDPDLAARVRALRQYGWAAKYRVTLPGGRNSRLDELQAAFLRAKLSRLRRWNAARVAIARRYCDALEGPDLVMPQWSGNEYVAHLFVVRTHDRDALRAALAARGIGSEIHYPVPDHQQPIMISSARPRLPMTEAACREVLSLPCYPGLADAQVDAVIDAVRFHYRGAATS